MNSLIWVAHLPMFGDCSSTMFASPEQPKSQCSTHERCLCSYFFAPENIVPDIEWCAFGPAMSISVVFLFGQVREPQKSQSDNMNSGADVFF